jgi:hypothetical protein
MQIPTASGSVTGGELFKLVWRGYFVGLLVLFAASLLIAIPVALSNSGSNDAVNFANLAIAMLMVPLVAAGQGVMIAGLVLLGLGVRPPTKPEGGESSAAL